MANEDNAPSFSSYFLFPKDGSRVDAKKEDNIKWCSAALYSGRADTVSTTSLIVTFLRFTPTFQTVAVMTAFFLLMMEHPGSQR